MEDKLKLDSFWIEFAECFVDFSLCSAIRADLRVGCGLTTFCLGFRLIGTGVGAGAGACVGTGFGAWTVGIGVATGILLPLRGVIGA